MQIKWTANAVKDLQSLRTYIEKDKPGAARKPARKIIAAIEEDLLMHPGMGRAGRIPGTRELVVSGTPYFIPYRVDGDYLVVLRILHGAMQWP